MQQFKIFRVTDHFAALCWHICPVTNQDSLVFVGPNVLNRLLNYVNDPNQSDAYGYFLAGSSDVYGYFLAGSRVR